MSTESEYFAKKISLWNDVLSASPSLDFSFVFPDGFVQKAHRNVLIEKLEFFAVMASSGMADSSAATMSVDHASPSHFKTFLKFIYTDQFEVPDTPESFFDLLKLGRFFCAPALCEHLLRTAPRPYTLFVAEYVFQTFEEIPPLLRRNLIEFMACNFEEQSTRGVSHEAVSQTLSLAAGLRCASLHCFRLLETWAKANERADCVVDMLAFIAFEGMWQEEFEAVVAVSPLVPKEMLSDLRSKVPKPHDFATIRTTHCTKLPVSLPLTGAVAITTSPTAPTEIYVSKFESDESPPYVHIFDPSGKCLSTFNCRGKGVGTKHVSPGLAVTLDRKIFVSNKDNNRVQLFSVIDNRSAKLECSFGTRGLGQFCAPHGLAIDHTRQELHVCDEHSHRVSVFTLSGDYLFSYGQGTVTRPSAIAVDGERGLSFVIGNNSNQIFVFNTSGEFMRHFVLKENPETRALRRNFHLNVSFSDKTIALDPHSSTILVTNNQSNAIHVLNRDGQHLAWVPFFELGDVSGVVFGQEGQMFALCQKSPGRRRGSVECEFDIYVL